MDRVSEILTKRLLGGERPFWLLSKYLRRGRLVDFALTMLACGDKKVEDEWWSQASGELRCKRFGHLWPWPQSPTVCPMCGFNEIDDSDFVPHEECRPYIEGGQRFLRDNPRLKLIQHHFEVEHPVYHYKGHPDWLMNGWVNEIAGRHLIDVKCGEPPKADTAMDLYERYQLALYESALGRRTIRWNLHVFDGDYRIVQRNNRNDKYEAEVEVQHHIIMSRIGA